MSTLTFDQDSRDGGPSRPPGRSQSHGPVEVVDDVTPAADLSGVGGGVAVGPAGRIAGIDIARGLALLGMFVVHVFIDGDTGPTLSWILSAPSGQASVLFFILSGVSLSVIAGRGSRSAEPGVLRRRGAVLIAGGLLLSATVWGASILEHYGVMFVLAPWLLRRSDRALTALATGGLVLGPVVRLAALGRGEEWLYEIGGVTSWIGNTVVSLALSGIYPLVIWVGFFVLGVWLGRLDLGARRTAAAFAGWGCGRHRRHQPGGVGRRSLRLVGGPFDRRQRIGRRDRRG